MCLQTHKPTIDTLRSNPSQFYAISMNMHPLRPRTAPSSTFDVFDTDQVRSFKTPLIEALCSGQRLDPSTEQSIKKFLACGNATLLGSAYNHVAALYKRYSATHPAAADSVEVTETPETPPRTRPHAPYAYPSPGGKTSLHARVFESPGRRVYVQPSCGNKGAQGQVTPVYATGSGVCAVKSPHATTTPAVLKRLQREQTLGQTAGSKAAICRITQCPSTGTLQGWMPKMQESMKFFIDKRIVTQMHRSNPLECADFLDSWASDLLRKMHTIHSQGVAHRDIKPHNILWDAEGAHFGDFGLACTLEEHRTRTCSLKVGSPLYFPPENILYGNPELWSVKNPERADLWSLGASLLHIITETEPPLRHCARMSPTEKKITLDAEIYHATITEFQQLRQSFLEQPDKTQPLDPALASNRWYPALSCLKERCSQALFETIVLHLLRPSPEERDVSAEDVGVFLGNATRDPTLHSCCFEKLSAKMPRHPHEQRLKRSAPRWVQLENGWTDG